MRLLRADTEELIFETVHDDTHKYAILSHRWLAEGDEVTFADIVKSSGDKSHEIRAKKGCQKLAWCKQQAVRDGLQYIWADTACIDKSSSQELTESINAMYRWYEKSEVCYVYLHDLLDRDDVNETSARPAMGDTAAVSEAHTLPVHGRTPTQDSGDVVVHSTEDLDETSPPLRSSNPPDLEAQRLLCTQATVPAIAPSKLMEGLDLHAFARAEWFTRAWILQEMIAPSKVWFYSKSWSFIGELHDMATEIAKITRVHEQALMKKRLLKSYIVA